MLIQCQNSKDLRFYHFVADYIQYNLSRIPTSLVHKHSRLCQPLDPTVSRDVTERDSPGTRSLTHSSPDLARTAGQERTSRD